MRTSTKRVGFGVVLLAAWWAWPRGDGSPVRPRRSPLAHAVGASLAAPPEGAAHDSAAPDAPEPDDAPEARWPSTTLAIVLPEVGGRHLVWPRTARLDPAGYWPVDLVDPPLAAELQDLVALDLPIGHPRERDWVDAVAQEVLPEGPASALLVLEATRRAERIAREDALEEELLGLPEGTRVAPEVLLGPQDPVDTEDLALAVVEAWPEAPEAEVARLYLLEAAAVRGDAAVALDLFAELDEGGAPLEVLAQAAGALSRLDPRLVRTEIDAPGLARLGAVFDAEPDAAAALDVASFGAELALEGDEPVGPWIDRLDAAYAARCVDDEAALCAHHAANLDDLVARDGRVGPEDAADWRQGAKIAAVRCAAGVPRPIRVEAEGAWTGHRWSFAAWDRGPAALTACVERGLAAAPPPEAPVLVRFTVIGYPQAR